MSYPFKAFPVSKTKPRKLGAKMALAGGIALLAAGSLSAAEVYTRAEITIGGPNAQITLGKTWETGHDCDRTEKDDYVIEKRVILSDDDCHHHEHGKVVVYRNHPRCDREVRVIRHIEHDCHHSEYGKVVVYRNHNRCDRDVRIIRHVEPVRCDRDIRIIRSNGPHRTHRTIVVNAPDRHHDNRVIVTHRDRGHSDHKDWKYNRGHDGHKEYKDRGHNGHNGHKEYKDRGNGGHKEYKDKGNGGDREYKDRGNSGSNDRPVRLSRERGQRGRTL